MAMAMAMAMARRLISSKILQRGFCGEATAAGNVEHRLRLFSDVLNHENTTKAWLDPDTMHPDRLLRLRTKPFFYKVIRILEDPDSLTDLRVALRVWEGAVDQMLLGEVLRQVKSGRAALAFFNWAATQQGFEHTGFTYNCLIRCLELNSCYPVIHDIYQRMLYIGVTLTGFTFDVTLRALGKSGELPKLKLVWREMERRGFKPHPTTYRAILTCYCKNGEVKDAYDVFAEVTRWPKPVCLPHSFYNKFIEILVDTRNVEAAYLVFVEMIEAGYEGENTAVGKLVTGLYNAGLVRSALKTFDEFARQFQTAFTGRMGRPGDSIADHYLFNVRKVKKRWREEVLKPLERKAKHIHGSRSRHVW